MRKRIYIIHNPASGACGRGRLNAVVSRLRAAGATLEETVTARHGEGQMRARRAAASGRFDAVVAAGGDGTIHDVAKGLAGSGCPLGVIPMGTGNIFAREIELGFAPSPLADTLLSGPVREISLGAVNGEPFVFVAGIGFDAAVLRLFETGKFRSIGRAGFVVPVLRALAKPSNGPLRAHIDGAEHTAQWIIVNRIRHYAANFVLTPDAGLRDERLHVVLFSGSGAIRRVRQMMGLALERLAGEPSVTILACKTVTIAGKPDTPVEIDGEVKGRLPLELGLHRDRLSVIFPPSK